MTSPEPWAKALDLPRISDYRQLIALDTPWDAPAAPSAGDIDALLQPLVAHFECEDGVVQMLRRRQPTDAVAGAGRTNEQLLRLRALLTVRLPGELPSPVAKGLDLVLQHQLTLRAQTAAASLPTLPGLAPIALWRGDITTLRADAIVNAANAQMLGCFEPMHACIDNAIHWQAGPRLRLDCDTLMRLQGRPEPTGTAKITRGYNLPSRFVVHTVGPIVRTAQPTPADRSALQSAYTACLDAAAAVDSIHTLAFCGISTGVFGYPKAEAAWVALDAIQAWLVRHPGRFSRIVINLFSDADEAAYAAALRDR
jgi:O-acetyl-ADP-ribose deacetylase (regulator of RNase III)